MCAFDDGFVKSSSLIFVETGKSALADRNLVLASTGTFIGRANNADYTIIPEITSKLRCDGIELLFMMVWNDRLQEIAKEVKSSGVNIYSAHLDKNIGMLFSEGTDKDDKDALKMFEKNIIAAKISGAKIAVLHLWGGPKSDGQIARTKKHLSQMYKISNELGVTLTIENIPCLFSDPLSVWKELHEEYPEIRFTFDTRFAAYHDQYMDIYNSGLWTSVAHVHVSSFNGKKNEIGFIRPILHYDEGAIDFDHLFSNMPLYKGAVVLESPALKEDGSINTDRLNKSLDHIRDSFAKYNIYNK